jgi:hypothetical protein
MMGSLLCEDVSFAVSYRVSGMYQGFLGKESMNVLLETFATRV